MKSAKDPGLLTGEFAQLYGVSKDTLLYYDKIGLFRPRLRAENGYRLYSLDQLHQFDLILMLRLANLPIEDIAAYLNDCQPEQLLVLLQAQVQRLSQQIAGLERIKEKMENTAEMIRYGTGLPCGQPRIEHRSEARFLAIRATPEMARDRHLRMSFARKFLQSHQVQESAADCLSYGVVLLESLKREQFAKDYFCVRVDLDARRLEGAASILRPAGTYGVIEHKGAEGPLEDSYRKLLQFVREQGGRLTGNAYETELLGFASFQDDREYVVQIAVQIQS